MSYTPENQRIDTYAFSDAIDEFLKPVEERIRARTSWTKGHLEYLHGLRRRLLDLQFEIHNIPSI